MQSYLDQLKHESLQMYVNQIIISEKNLSIVENYYNTLKVFLNDKDHIYNKSYYQWINYLEIIYIQIDFINNTSIYKKTERFKNMNKLIDLISKKAADITINLSELSNTLNKEIKSSKLLLEKYKKDLIFLKTKIIIFSYI